MLVWLQGVGSAQKPKSLVSAPVPSSLSHSPSPKSIQNPIDFGKTLLGKKKGSSTSPAASPTFGKTQDEEWQQEGNHIGTAATPQQLRILQSLLPNSTKTDARSILEDVSDYLKEIHQEMEQIEKELSKRSEDNGSSSSGRSSSGPSPAPNILRVETEKLGQSRFVVKIISKKGPGVAAQVQRVFESLELDVKLTSLKCASIFKVEGSRA